MVLGAAGFDAENTQLIFVQKRHTAAYGTPNDGGVLGHVVGGKNTLDRLETGDKIQGIEPIVEWQDLTEKLATMDLTLLLEDGMEIFTRIQAELIEDAPLGGGILPGPDQRRHLKGRFRLQLLHLFRPALDGAHSF